LENGQFLKQVVTEIKTFFLFNTYAKKNRIFSFIRGKRQITYKINLQTGRPEMTDVTEI
jgi:hypothetical protein